MFFAKEAYKVDLENVNFFTLPGIDAREYVDSGAWYYVMKKQDTLNIINAHFNVFNTDISSDIFDINGYFTSTDKPHLHSIYTSPATEDVSGLGTSAESIENNSLDIPRAGY